MIKTLISAVAAASLLATPAVAQTNANFVGPRVELNAGVDDVRNAKDWNDVTYGAAVGGDVGLGDRVTLGAEAAASNVFNNDGREFGAGLRLGYALTPNVLAYGRAGYSTVDLRHENLDGLNIGGGLNFALTHNVYTNLEYRYTDFEHNVGRHGARVGVGIRF